MIAGRRTKLAIFQAALLAVLALVVATLGLTLAVGPASNLYPVGPLEPTSSLHPGGKVFVRNPELTEEFEILQASGVFEIVSADQASKVVVLHPRETAAVCGTSLLLPWITNGLVPATVPLRSTFSFTLEENGVASEQQYVLEAERRASPLQHLFRPFRSDTRTWGAILASEYDRGRK